MKLVKSALVTFISSIAILSAGSAHAIPIDTVVSNPDKIVSLSSTVQFNHDFTDQGFQLGVTDYLSGLLRVRLTDAAAGERGTLTIGTQTLDFQTVANNTRDELSPNGSFFEIALNNSSLADLELDGLIQVTITATQGNFYFADSTLTLTEVPEPISLALLGAGLLGIGAARRRRTIK